ncbi:hypothetical protein C8R45DRAFT_1106439 [Mycena sanguinolenta]|nr:hypothetical protein C8R45DRAFT_1106439 [Mycena sanguinolenta]
MPLKEVTELLAQLIPDDLTTATDFDIYQYISYRPITRRYDFGGMPMKHEWGQSAPL